MFLFIHCYSCLTIVLYVFSALVLVRNGKWILLRMHAKKPFFLLSIRFPVLVEKTLLLKFSIIML